MTYIRDGRDMRKRVAVDGHGHMSLTSIGYVHELIHAGVFFTTGHMFTTIANNGVVNILFRTGPIQSHIRWQLFNSAEGEARIFEGATVSADGTPLAVINRKRTSSKTAGATAFHTPTITGTGTTLQEANVPGGQGNGASGSFSNGFDELILKPDTNYVFRFTNTGGNAQDAAILLHFYELDV